MSLDGRFENLLPLTVVILGAEGKIISSKSEDWSGIMRLILRIAKLATRSVWAYAAAYFESVSPPVLNFSRRWRQWLMIGF